MAALRSPGSPWSVKQHVLKGSLWFHQNPSSRRRREPLTAKASQGQGSRVHTPDSPRAAHPRPWAGPDPQSRSRPGRDRGLAAPGPSPRAPLPPTRGRPADLQTQGVPAHWSWLLSRVPPAWARRPPGSALLCVSQRPRGPRWSDETPGASFPHLPGTRRQFLPALAPNFPRAPTAPCPASPLPPWPSRSPHRTRSGPSADCSLCLTALTCSRRPQSLSGGFPCTPAKPLGPGPAAPSRTRKAPSSQQPQGHFPRLGALVSPQVPGWVSPHPRFAQGPAVVCTGGSSAHGQLHRPRRAPGATRSRPGPSSRTVSPRPRGCGLGRPRRTAPKWGQKRNPQSTRRGRPWQGEGTGSQAPPPAPLPILDLPWQLAWPPWALG